MPTRRRSTSQALAGCHRSVMALSLAVVVMLGGAGGAHGATVTEFSAGITPASSPGAITAGPDGNLWFTEPGTNRIGRITPTGTVTEFSAGITHRAPGRVVL